MKNRLKLSLTALLMISLSAMGAAEPAAEPGYSDGWGPTVGTALPMLKAQNQAGVEVELADLVGREGLLLVLVRSADW